MAQVPRYLAIMVFCMVYSLLFAVVLLVYFVALSILHWLRPMLYEKIHFVQVCYAWSAPVKQKERQHQTHGYSCENV